MEFDCVSSFLFTLNLIFFPNMEYDLVFAMFNFG